MCRSVREGDSCSRAMTHVPEASGTCVIALLQLSPSRTLLHIRERHEAQGRDRVLAWAGVAAESLSSLSMLRDLRDACVGGLVDA